VGVQARQRSVRLRSLQLVFGPAGDVGRIPAELRRLLEKQTALDDRPACFQARLDRADALDVRHREALGPESGKSVVHSELPAVGGTARLHEDQAGGKTAELRLVR